MSKHPIYDATPQGSAQGGLDLAAIVLTIIGIALVVFMVVTR